MDSTSCQMSPNDLGGFCQLNFAGADLARYGTVNLDVIRHDLAADRRLFPNRKGLRRNITLDATVHLHLAVRLQVADDVKVDTDDRGCRSCRCRPRRTSLVPITL